MRSSALSHRLVLAVPLGLLFLPGPARAIVIDAGGKRVAGHLVSDSGKKLVIRAQTPDGKDKETEYDRAKIKIIHQVDRQRLEGLSKDNPKAYRDYAEELADHTSDPEARDVALRLFLISAYLDKKLAPRSLLSMSSLASTPAEARRIRALAYLLDAHADAAMLKAPPEKRTQQLSKTEAAALQNLLKALQDYRTGKIKSARDYARADGMDKLFLKVPGLGDQKTFLQRCTDAACTSCKDGKVTCPTCNGQGVTVGAFNQQQRCQTCGGRKAVACSTCDGTGAQAAPPDDVLRITLRAELWALDQLTGGQASAKDPGGTATWSSLIQSRQVDPVLPLNLETLMTDYDPRRCVYRNGRWVTP